MISFSITQVVPKDVEQIREVQKAVWLATYPNKANRVTTEAIQAQFADKGKTSNWINKVKQALLSGESSGWVAKVDKKFVGYCFARRMDDKNRIMAMYILPLYQKQGIGKALMERMLGWIDKTKPTALEVASYNTHAINFYKSFGFVEKGPIKNEEAALQTGIVIPEIEMVKE